MLGKLRQLLRSGGAKGPQPTCLCVWRGLDDLELLASELQAEAGKAIDWNSWREQLSACRQGK